MDLGLNLERMRRDCRITNDMKKQKKKKEKTTTTTLLKFLRLP